MRAFRNGATYDQENLGFGSAFAVSMSVGCSEIEYAAVRLPDGHVAHATEANSADLFDPEAGTWAPAGLMNAARAGHVDVVLRGTGGVLVIGGLTKSPAPTGRVHTFEWCRWPALG